MELFAGVKLAKRAVGNASLPMVTRTGHNEMNRMQCIPAPSRTETPRKLKKKKNLKMRISPFFGRIFVCDIFNFGFYVSRLKFR